MKRKLGQKYYEWEFKFWFVKYDVEKEIISPMPTDALLHGCQLLGDL